MKKKMIGSMAAALAVSAVAGFAAEEAMDTPVAVSAVSSEEVEAAPALSIEERLAALEAQSKQSSWSGKVTISGDLRYRYENINDDDGAVDENRQRIRARLGAYADVNDATKAGLRIRTGQSANSGNETIGDEWESKGIYLDLAYLTIAPKDGRYGAATLGKMKYPWKVVTDLIWDSDVNPEGIVYTYSAEYDTLGVFTSAGYFKVEDDALANDLDLASIQLGVAQPLGENTKLTVGGSLFAYYNAIDYGAPVDYTIMQLFSEVGFKDLLPVPFKVYGDYVNNTEESSDNQGICVGVKFGDAKKGDWEAKLGYRDLDANAAPDPFTDSDFAGGGTDVKGFRVKGKYNLYKNLQAGVTYIAGEQKTSGNAVNTLHLDLIAKF